MNKKEWLLDEIEIVGGLIAFSIVCGGLIAFVGWILFEFGLPMFLIVWSIVAIIVGCAVIMEGRLSLQP